MNPFVVVKRGEYRSGDTKVIAVDTRKSSYFGKPWTSLSNYEKRKFENNIVISDDYQKVKVVYE